MGIRGDHSCEQGFLFRSYMLYPAKKLQQTMGRPRVVVSVNYGAGAVSQIPGDILTHPVGEADFITYLEFGFHLVSSLISLKC